MGPMGKLAAAMRAEAERRGELSPSERPSNIREPSPGSSPIVWRSGPDDMSRDASRPHRGRPHDRRLEPPQVVDGGATRGGDFFAERDDATADHAPADARSGTPRRTPPVPAALLGGIV